MVLQMQIVAVNEKPPKKNVSQPQDQKKTSGSPFIFNKKRPAIKALKAKILRGLVNLPPMPHIILKAREIIADSDSSLKELADIIENDQALVAKVLTLANSAYYGVSGMVSSIQHASVLLGQKTLGQLVTISASSSLLTKKLKVYQVAPAAMWKHSLACAFSARSICEKTHPDLAEDAFVAGLLHDAGKIILDPYLDGHKDEFERMSRQQNRPYFEAEKAIIGFDHAEIMARACRLWRFPEDQVIAIRYHHSPLDSENREMACIVHAANILAKSAGFKAGGPSIADDIDPDILAFLNLEPKDLDIIAVAVIDDVHNIEKEVREG
jgi:HD-like signal output (HDOD) protein